MRKEIKSIMLIINNSRIILLNFTPKYYYLTYRNINILPKIFIKLLQILKMLKTHTHKKYFMYIS